MPNISDYVRHKIPWSLVRRQLKLLCVNFFVTISGVRSSLRASELTLITWSIRESNPCPVAFFKSFLHVYYHFLTTPNISLLTHLNQSEWTTIMWWITTISGLYHYVQYQATASSPAKLHAASSRKFSDTINSLSFLVFIDRFKCFRCSTTCLLITTMPSQYRAKLKPHKFKNGVDL